jgi:hypothetical protein
MSVPASAANGGFWPAESRTIANVIVSVVRANQLRQGLHDHDADRVQGRMVDREVGDATSDPALDEMIPPALRHACSP